MSLPAPTRVKRVERGAIAKALATTDGLFTNNCSIENKQYGVKKVFDGDTILIEKGAGDTKKGVDGEKIRLLGIDAFEHDQNIYGIRGKDFLSMLVLNKGVCVEIDVQRNDVYGRTLGYVFVNNLSINEELLKNGLAILYDFPPNTKYLSRLKKAQIYARENMLGIWEKQNYILETPAQWRYKSLRHK